MTIARNLMAGLVGFALFAGAAKANLITNGDFETGDLSGWTTFTTANGSLGTPGVMSFDTAGSGASNSAVFEVGDASSPGPLEGGGIFQNITVPTATNDLQIWADIASEERFDHDNAAGGLFELLFDGTVVDSHDFGDIGPFTTERASLHAVVNATGGTHEVRIRMERPYVSEEDNTPYQHIDNVQATVPVPEPGTLTLFGLGLAGLGFARRWRAHAA